MSATRGATTAESAPPARADVPATRASFAILVAAIVAAAAGVAFAWWRPLPLLGWQPVSAAAGAAIAACPGPLYNGYNEGGYLIWFVRSQPVFIDGRHDPYPPELLIEDRRVETGEADFRPMFERHGIRCAALSAGAFLAPRLEAAGWRRRFSDRQWVVLARP